MYESFLPNMLLMSAAVELRLAAFTVLLGSKVDGSTSVVTNHGSISISTSLSGYCGNFGGFRPVGLKVYTDTY
jgi:hypothetical protein